MNRVIALPVLAMALTACSNGLSLSDCQKDTECATAFNMTLSANQTVSSVCPRNARETSPACANAMATLDVAEGSLFPRLKHSDALTLSSTLMATR